MISPKYQTIYFDAQSSVKMDTFDSAGLAYRQNLRGWRSLCLVYQLCCYYRISVVLGCRDLRDVIMKSKLTIWRRHVFLLKLILPSFGIFKDLEISRKLYTGPENLTNNMVKNQEVTKLSQGHYPEHPDLDQCRRVCFPNLS